MVTSVLYLDKIEVFLEKHYGEMSIPNQVHVVVGLRLVGTMGLDFFDFGVSYYSWGWPVWTGKTSYGNHSLKL